MCVLYSGWKDNAMNGKQVIDQIGITYSRLRYFVRRIDALTKKETSQGHENDFSFRDLVFLQIATLMRSDGIGLDDINKGINILDEKWTDLDDNPKMAGTIIRLDEKPATWIWTLLVFPFGSDDGYKYRTRLPGSMYFASVIAQDLSRNDQLELELTQENRRI